MKHNKVQPSAVAQSSIPQQQQPQTITYAVQGPLPSAIEMQGYAKVNPDLPLRIVAMAEKQAAHRQALEKKALEAQLKIQRAGQWFAFTLGLAGIIGGTLNSLYGSPWSGIAQFFGSLAALIWAFVYGTRSNRQERQDKWNKVQ